MRLSASILVLTVLASACGRPSAGDGAATAPPEQASLSLRDLVTQMRSLTFDASAATRLIGASARVTAEHPAMKPCNNYLRVDLAVPAIQARARDAVEAELPTGEMTRSVFGSIVHLRTKWDAGDDPPPVAFDFFARAGNAGSDQITDLVLERYRYCPEQRVYQSEDEGRALLARLEYAVGGSHRAEVAALLENPVRVNWQVDDSRMLNTPADFIGHYDRIVYDRTKRAIRESRGEELFHNAEGYMIGDGAIWFEGDRIHAINVVIGRDDPMLRGFLKDLQSAVAANDKSRVASLVAFPLTWQTGDRETTIKTKAAFLNQYDRIVTSAVKELVAAARPDTLVEILSAVAIRRGEDPPEIQIGPAFEGPGVIRLRSR